MSSKADLSLFIHSITQESTQPKGRSRSAYTTWVYSRTVYETDGEDPKYRYCIYCTTTPIYKTYTTGNLRNHLKSKHEIIVERELSLVQSEVIKQLEQLYLQAEQSSETDQIDSQVFQKFLDQDVINEALVSLIVV